MKHHFFVFAACAFFTGCSAHLLDIYTPPQKNPHAISFTTEKLSAVDDGFKLIAENVPPNRIFTLSSKTAGQEYRMLQTFQSDANGRLFELGGDHKPLEACTFKFQEAKPAQGYDFWLDSQDKTTSLHTTIIPKPVEAFAMDGAHIWLVVKTYDAAIIDCIGKGLHGQERIAILFRSGLNVMSDTITCNEKGEFIFTLFPTVIAREAGAYHVEIIRVNNEVLTLDFS